MYGLEISDFYYFAANENLPFSVFLIVEEDLLKLLHLL
jgi:hypothetical protein